MEVNLFQDELKNTHYLPLFVYFSWWKSTNTEREIRDKRIYFFAL